MTNLERDAIDGNYPSYGDFIRLAQAYYPMNDQLHQFIERTCELVGWPKEETFRRIFRDSGEIRDR